ncbi:restriction endonuclease subunit S [Bacteroides fragilis]|uniref:restriction endonuclease subunit S n=1 Tax=Bacteroides fragilis TaxID=817 RepID=UPI0004477DA6|nr:restriction endonuclease subunit S [Bacteroides fragilis]EXY17686.1 type I restriction modification DNA specificity domain protein [Bacteroides fragilis str. 2-F-2 \
MADNKENKVLNVPALRFPEFTEEWNYESLDTIAPNITSGRSKPSLGEYNLYGSTGIIGKTATADYSGDMLLVARVGANAGSLQLVNDSCGITDNTLIIKSCKLSSHYLYFYLQHYNLNRLVFGSGQPLITAGMLKKVRIPFGNQLEQKKIENFLCCIDERITTQNKIIEDLKKLKSAIVEMILCKQGGVLLKLGDVGSFIRGLTYSSEDIAEDINATTVIRANNLNYGNNVSKKDVVYVNKKPTEIQILRKGDIVICMANGSSSLVGKNSYYSFDDRQSTIGAFCGIYRSSQPLVKWLMQSQRYRRLVYQSLQGGNGAIANLNGDDILNMTFYVVEDKKSVSILSALVLIENSIAVNEKLQELYSMQKEYLLQHLFI